MRFLFDRASTTGKTHRLVLDLETGRYWAEVSDDKFYIPREAETIDVTRKREAAEMEEDDDCRQAEEKAASSASSSLGTSTLPTDSSYDPTKLDVGEFRPKHARFAAFKESRAQARDAQEGHRHPQRLHAALDRSRDERACVHLLLPAGPDRARDRDAVRRR